MSDSYLDLEYTKKGIPKRLVLKCSSIDTSLVLYVSRGLGKWSRKDRLWYFPVDPILIKGIIASIPCKVNQTVWDYIDLLHNKQMKIFSAIENGSPLSPNDKLWGEVQRASVRFLVEGERVILAHDMGLGKTVISCKAIEYLGVPKVLIVCPNSVKWSWAEHLVNWNWTTPIVVAESGGKSKGVLQKLKQGYLLYGDKSEREDLFEEVLATYDSFAMVINYDQLKMHLNIFNKFTYDVLIADEAHRVKNRQAQRTQAMKSMIPNTANLWLLTGTPIRNSYTDVYSLLNFCDPARFKSYWNFVTMHMETLRNPYGGTTIIGLKNPDEFNSMLSTYMYRKTKKEALPELPDKIYTDIPLPLTSQQARAYTSMENAFILHIRKLLESGQTVEDILKAENTISQMIRLRQICLNPAILDGVDSSAKLNALDDLCQDLVAKNKQFIVFTWFRSFVPYIQEVLDHNTIRHAVIKQGQKAQERKAIQDALTEGKVQAILGTIGSMGEGMNLQAADTSIFMDKDWVPANNLQAEDRVHRAGITRSPNIITLYHPNTIEEDIRRVCARKERMTEETIGQVEVVRSILKRGGNC